NQLRGKPGKSIEFLFRRTELEERILAFNITGFAQCFTQLRPKGLDICIVYEERTNSIDLRLLLRACRNWPGRHAAHYCDELAPSHSIPSSAATSSFSSTVRPSILAVETLMTSSNLLDCATGKSAGFAPLRMRPVYTPMWRYASTRLAP